MAPHVGQETRSSLLKSGGNSRRTYVEDERMKEEPGDGQGIFSKIMPDFSCTSASGRLSLLSLAKMKDALDGVGRGWLILPLDDGGEFS